MNDHLRGFAAPPQVVGVVGELAGVDRSTPQPEGGVIEYDDDGELNGVIRERQGIVGRLVPDATPEELRTKIDGLYAQMIDLDLTTEAAEARDALAQDSRP